MDCTVPSNARCSTDGMSISTGEDLAGSAMRTGWHWYPCCTVSHVVDQLPYATGLASVLHLIIRGSILFVHPVRLTQLRQHPGSSSVPAT